MIIIKPRHIVAIWRGITLLTILFTFSKTTNQSYHCSDIMSATIFPSFIIVSPLFYNGFRSTDNVHAALEGIETLALQVVDGSGLRGGFCLTDGAESGRHALNGFVFCHCTGHVCIEVTEAVETVGVGGQTLNSDGKHNR